MVAAIEGNRGEEGEKTKVCIQGAFGLWHEGEDPASPSWGAVQGAESPD